MSSESSPLTKRRHQEIEKEAVDQHHEEDHDLSFYDAFYAVVLVGFILVVSSHIYETFVESSHETTSQWFMGYR